MGKYLCVSLTALVIGVLAAIGGYLGIFFFIMSPTGIQISAIVYCAGWIMGGAGVLALILSPVAYLVTR